MFLNIIFMVLIIIVCRFMLVWGDLVVVRV